MENHGGMISTGVTDSSTGGGGGGGANPQTKTETKLVANPGELAPMVVIKKAN
jgi:hypothetical protein